MKLYKQLKGNYNQRESCGKIRCVKTARLSIIHSVLNSRLSRWVPLARDKLKCNAALGGKRSHQLPKTGEFQGCGDLGDPQVQQAGEARAALRGPHLLGGGHDILKAQLAPKLNPFVPNLLFPHFYTRFSPSCPPPPCHEARRALEPELSPKGCPVFVNPSDVYRNASPTPNNCLKAGETFFRKEGQTTKQRKKPFPFLCVILFYLLVITCVLEAWKAT